MSSQNCFSRRIALPYGDALDVVKVLYEERSDTLVFQFLSSNAT